MSISNDNHPLEFDISENINDKFQPESVALAASEFITLSIEIR
jgi:hypothetical protein